MKRAIVARGDFFYHIQLESVRSPKGMFQLVLSSQWRQAKDPDAEHVKASLLLDAKGLRLLRQLVNDALEQSQEGGVV